MSATSAAVARDRLARIRLGLPDRVTEPVPLVPVQTVARCVYCGVVARRDGSPVTCHAHSDLPELEAS